MGNVASIFDYRADCMAASFSISHPYVSFRVGKV